MDQMRPSFHAERKLRFLMQLLLSTNRGEGEKIFLKKDWCYEGCYGEAVTIRQLLNHFNGTFSITVRLYVLRYPGGTSSHIDLLSSQEKLNK